MKTVKPKLSYNQGDPLRKLPDVKMTIHVDVKLADHMADYAVEKGLAEYTEVPKAVMPTVETKVIEVENKEGDTPEVEVKKPNKKKSKSSGKNKS